MADAPEIKWLQRLTVELCGVALSAVEACIGALDEDGTTGCDNCREHGMTEQPLPRATTLVAFVDCDDAQPLCDPCYESLRGHASFREVVGVVRLGGGRREGMSEKPEIQWVRVPSADKRGPVEGWLKHVAGMVSDPEHAILRGCDNHDAPAHHVVVRHSPPDVKEATRQCCDSCYENELIDGCDVLAVVHLPADAESEKPVRYVPCHKCSGNGCYRKEPAEACRPCGGSGRAGTPDDLSDCGTCKGTGCVLVDCDRCEGETIVPADDAEADAQTAARKGE